MSEITLANIKEWVGREFGVSDWLLVDQARIAQFADCTGDHQWIQPAGVRVRLRASVDRVEERNHGQILLKTKSVLEIENSNKPALIAETLTLLIPAKPTK